MPTPWPGVRRRAKRRPPRSMPGKLAHQLQLARSLRLLGCSGSARKPRSRARPAAARSKGASGAKGLGTGIGQHPSSLPLLGRLPHQVGQELQTGAIGVVEVLPAKPAPGEGRGGAVRRSPLPEGSAQGRLGPRGRCSAAGRPRAELGDRGGRPSGASAPPRPAKRALRLPTGGAGPERPGRRQGTTGILAKLLLEVAEARLGDERNSSASRPACPPPASPRGRTKGRGPEPRPPTGPPRSRST